MSVVHSIPIPLYRKCTYDLLATQISHTRSMSCTTTNVPVPGLPDRHSQNITSKIQNKANLNLVYE